MNSNVGRAADSRGYAVAIVATDDIALNQGFTADLMILAADNDAITVVSNIDKPGNIL